MADPATEDRIARLQLIRTPNIGPVSYRQLLRRFGDPVAAIAALPDLARQGGGAIKIWPRAEAERELGEAARRGARHLFLGLPDYPALLAELETAPPAVILAGNAALLDRPAVAMVGARNASAAACRFARDLAAALGNEAVTIVSGLARGIDTAAHGGSIASGTVAVIASGLDIGYPPENAGLQQRIAEEGLLISEQPFGREPLARHFPARNRIIAGLALGTVVVEAAPKSGSLITARIAAEAGREVMAVPGSPLDQRAQGCNLLIREGATLIQSAADVLEAIRPIDPRLRQQREPWQGLPPAAADAATADRDRIAMLLGPVPVAVDELIRQSALAPAIVQLVLLELELGGRLERHAGGRVSLA